MYEHKRSTHTGRTCPSGTPSTTNGTSEALISGVRPAPLTCRTRANMSCVSRRPRASLTSCSRGGGGTKYCRDPPRLGVVVGVVVLLLLLLEDEEYWRFVIQHASSRGVGEDRRRLGAVETTKAHLVVILAAAGRPRTSNNISSCTQGHCNCRTLTIMRNCILVDYYFLVFVLPLTRHPQLDIQTTNSSLESSRQNSSSIRHEKPVRAQIQTQANCVGDVSATKICMYAGVLCVGQYFLQAAP